MNSNLVYFKSQLDVALLALEVKAKSGHELTIDEIDYAAKLAGIVNRLRDLEMAAKFGIGTKPRKARNTHVANTDRVLRMQLREQSVVSDHPRG